MSERTDDYSEGVDRCVLPLGLERSVCERLRRLCDAGRDGQIAVIRLAAHDCRGRRTTAEPWTRHALQAQSTASEFRKRIGLRPQLSSDRQWETTGQLYQPHVPEPCRFRQRHRCAIVQLLELRVQPTLSPRRPSRHRGPTYRRPVGRPAVEKRRDLGWTCPTATGPVFGEADKTRQTLSTL